MAELKELRLKNFKSFKRAVIPFKKGFTAIIGPNGSGKSNILDAILFALGSTSMKSLRAGKISNLINNSTSESYGMAEITIEDRGQTWKISRTVDRNGKSTCRVNGHKKNLNEVVSLLSELGFKSSEDNIVAQGDITRIIEMTPEQRREIIDNLAGIKEFDLKRAEAGKNLEKANERVKNANLILRERLSRIEALQEEKRAAEEYFKLEETKKRAKATLLELETMEVRKSLGENQEKLKKLKLEADTISKKTLALQQRISETEKEGKEKERELFEKQEESFRAILSKIESLKGEKNLLAEKEASGKRRLAANSGREEALSKKLELLREEAEREHKRLKGIALEKAGAEKELEKLKKELSLLEGKNDEKDRVGKTLESELASIEEELEKKQGMLTITLQKKSAVEKENSLAEKEISEIEKKILGLAPHRQKNQQLKEKISLLESKKLDKLIESTEKNLEKLVDQQKSLEAQAIQASDSLKELRKEIARCPVCESDLPPAKKRKLVEKREAEEKKALFESKRLSKEIAALKKQKMALKEKQNKLLALKQEAAIVAERVLALQALEEKRALLKARIKNTSKLNTEIERLSREIETLKAQRSATSKKLSSIKTDRKKIELNAKKSELDSILRMLEAEENSILQKMLPRIESEKRAITSEIDSIQKENLEIEKRAENAAKERKEIEKRLFELEEKNTEQKKALEEEKAKKEELEEKLSKLREKKTSLEEESREKARAMENIRIENGKLEVRLSDLEEESKGFVGVKPLKNMTPRELRRELASAEKKLEKIGAVNLKAAESLGEEKTELLEVKEKIDKLEEERNAVLEMIEKIEVKRKKVFMDCFEEVKKNFSEMFYKFFEGEGNLRLSSEENPTEAGLFIEARHKGEKIQDIDSMSGGEKTLTALAFIFAIQKVHPAPFYFFDEADAALDEENSLKLGRVIEDIGKNYQFIAITHNNSLSKAADQIIGVTLDREKSSVIGLNLKEKIAKENSK